MSGIVARVALDADAALLDLAAALRDGAASARSDLGPRAVHVYNPLDYAWSVHSAYVARFAPARPDALLVGMNPGPWGMVQTGVPFGDPVVVGEWMGLTGAVGQPPENERHRDRPVRGLESSRREVSGQRLYGLARDAFGGLEAFLARLWIVNYCPLAIFDAAGANVTPPQLSARERTVLAGPSDSHLREVIALLRPRAVVGIGIYAFERVQSVVDGLGPHAPAAARMLHPSPASPRANRDWASLALADLAAAGVFPASSAHAGASRSMQVSAP
jgi:single-strand selective monofunctional uracil DNA glycosylase